MEPIIREPVTDAQLKELIPDLPKGNLDEFRKKASFDWRRMKLAYDNVNTIALKNRMYAWMERHPLFQPDSQPLTLDETRRRTVKRMYCIYHQQFLPMEQLAADPTLFQAESEAMFMVDSSLAVKLSLTFRMFANAVRGSGRGHHAALVERLERAELGGCFALTELAHGSNARAVQTTATYDKDTKEFVFHSNGFEAAKFWVGCLGKCATHAIVYAQLVSNGTARGLHSFVVPVRDPASLRALPGVAVGDMGEKIGLNGVDNGWVMFSNYRVGAWCALDRHGGVDLDTGEYKHVHKDAAARFGASLAVLSGGRVHITSISTAYLQKAVVIATRYSAVRRQFGPPGGEEVPVLTYQQQQVRVLPWVAATFAQRIFCNWFSETHIVITINNMMGAEESHPLRGAEVHALSCCTKPICGWTARDGIQQCRESCGGHGYLKAAGLGELRDDNDANCTYEGENGLLLQQTSNWLLALWQKHRGVEAVEAAPYRSLDFLVGGEDRLRQKCRATTWEEVAEPEFLIETYKWLTLFLLKSTADKVEDLKRQGQDAFEVRNNSQAYFAKDLAVAYGECFILRHFYSVARDFPEPACRRVLLRLASLYGAFMLDKHLATLYIGGYLTSAQGALVRAGVVSQCARLQHEAVSLADALAPPDLALRSVLGLADGKVYEHIQQLVTTSPGALERPGWWRDVVHWQRYASKL